MGKTKKQDATSKTNKVEGQKTINSFFHKAAKDSKPQLFSEHGSRCSTSDLAGKRLNGPCIVINDDDDNDFKTSKAKDRPTEQSSGFTKTRSEVQISHSTLEASVKPQSNKDEPLSPCSTTLEHNVITCIPETQLLFTPPAQQCQKADRSHSDESKEMDTLTMTKISSHADFDGLIPDTPQERDEKPKPKRPLGRSFLLSSAQIATNPIQKAKENRQEKKDHQRKMNFARKGLLSVAVNFNGSDGMANTKTTDDDLRNSVTSALDKDCSLTAIKADVVPQCKDSVSEPSDHGETLLVTPTKVYKDSGSIKRMAKIGASPKPKRSVEGFDVNSDNVEGMDRNYAVGPIIKQLEFSNNTVNTPVSAVQDVCLETESKLTESPSIITKTAKGQGSLAAKVNQSKARHREKDRREELERQLAVKEERKRKSEKLLKYQLTGLIDEAGDKVTNSVTSADDDALCDILQELASPSLIAENKKPAEKRNSLPFTRTKPRQKECTNQNGAGVGENSKQFKSWELNHVLGSRGQTAESDWTLEDDEYFTQLGVDTGHSAKIEDVSKTEAAELGNRIPQKCSSSDKSLRKPVILTKKKRPGIARSSLSSVNTKSANLISPQSRTGDKIDVTGGTSLETTTLKKKHLSGLSNNLDALGELADDIEDFMTPCFLDNDGTKAEGMDIEEFVTQEAGGSIKAIKSDTASSVTLQNEPPCTNYGRHTVNKVTHDRNKQQTLLELSPYGADITRTCTLSGFWLDSQIEEGDVVHVLADFKDNHCDITDACGLLIVNPDLLISGTTVVSSVFCMRKAILKEKFKGCDSRNVHMLYGSIIHTVFQQMVKKRLCTEEDILAEAVSIVSSPNNLMEIYANKSTQDKVLDEIKVYIPQMLSWVQKHTQFNQTPASTRQSCPDIQVTKVCDVEENIWSPRFGIKGKIDLTVDVKMKNIARREVLPLELKTGKTSFSVEHKGQVSLYSMMYGDRRTDPNKGLLLYLKEAVMKLIPAEHIHQKGLIQMRNEMAHYISREVKKTSCDDGQVTFTLGRLPDPISNVRACQKCPQLVNCAIYQRQVEGRSKDASGMSGLVSESLGHLTPDHMAYFIHWCLMLDMEKQVDQSKKTLADIWCKSSLDREDLGLCLSGMKLSSVECEELSADTVLIVFHRQPEHTRNQPLSNVGICAQDSIVISREKPAWVAVCTGFAHEISPTSVTISTEREAYERLCSLKEETWRLDKSDSFSTAGILYTNISKLMTDDPHCEKLRRLIIGKAKPEFSNTLSKGSIEKVKTAFKMLNKPQKTAVLKVLMSKDYVLIKGYPGTGKTSTIVALVKVLNALGLSVLLTSYTHSAVDNILLKLKKDDVTFLRIGRLSKIHPDIKQYSVDKQTQGFTSTDQLETFFMSQPIVASSCLGMNHPLLSCRQFDVCIVDEASQVVQPACLGPLFMSKTFVLVGDPKQLPPVVQSKEARELGMDESLYIRLDGLGATFDLDLQYRMNSEIMKISNMLVYGGRLKCGNDMVANQSLQLTCPDIVSQITKQSVWMTRVLDESLSSSVIFLDTSKIQALHSRVKGVGLRNEAEAKIVVDIVTYLTEVGVHYGDIGVIAPYRSQVFHLREKLGLGQQGSRVEVNTVDQFQGRDKNIIIISFVMSSKKDKEQAGELLQDVRRLNVAVTRAKLKLILLGNRSTLIQYTPLKQLLDLLQEQQQIVTMEP